MPELVLYYKPTCPYCRKVLNYLAGRGLTLKMKDIEANPAARSELVKIGGKGQVPCLLIDQHALYESDDIIRWLDQNL